MSMNIYIVAEREVTAKATRSKFVQDIQRVKFDALQTSTIDTYNILRSENPVEAYVDYVKSCSRIEKLPVYAPDDPFGEREPIGFEEYDWAIGHAEEFKKWVAEMKWQGYTIKFEVI